MCYRSRAPLEPGLKLVITLRYLATGDSYRSLAYNFRVAHNTISTFIPEVCSAIYDEYKEEVFSLPSTPDQWQQIADQFRRRWNFHHTCGAIDGKHVSIRKPEKSGSLYYNYKGFCSIVLLGVADAEYKFIWANVGANGSGSDAGVFNGSHLRPALERGTLGFPPPTPFPGDDRDLPYFLVGDDAFPLRTWLMKPYSIRCMTDEQRIFNYRLSRARRVVENAFGIMAHRWRCLLTTLQISPQRARQVVNATLTLHNLLRRRYPTLQINDVDQEDVNGNVIPGAWREGRQMPDPNQVGGQRVTREGKEQRAYLSEYYCSAQGRVPWQDHIV